MGQVFVLRSHRWEERGREGGRGSILPSASHSSLPPLQGKPLFRIWRETGQTYIFPPKLGGFFHTDIFLHFKWSTTVLSLELWGQPKKCECRNLGLFFCWPMSKKKIISRIILCTNLRRSCQGQKRNDVIILQSMCKVQINIGNSRGRLVCWLTMAFIRMVFFGTLWVHHRYSVKAFLFTLFPHHLVEPSPLHPRRYFPHKTLFFFKKKHSVAGLSNILFFNHINIL